MRQRLKIVTCGAAMALLLGGCLEHAQMRLPVGLAEVNEQIALEGIGGWERGDLRAGSAYGSFKRTAIEEDADGGYVRRYIGGGTFSIEGPEIEGELSADCSYHEAEYDAGGISQPIDRFSYHCQFYRDGDPIDGALTLDEQPSRPGSFLSGRTRAGVVTLGGVTLDIRAVHEMDGGRVPTMDPIGYGFDLEGEPVAAVDINGGTKMISAPANGEHREIILAASIALSILWHQGA